MEFLKRLGVIVLIALAVSAVLYLATRHTVPTSLTGQQAKNFDFYNLDGQRRALWDLRGKPVLVNFWRSDCKPCIEELPVLDGIAGECPELVVWLVSLDTSRDAIEDGLRLALGDGELQHAEVRYCGEDRYNLRQLYRDYAIEGIPRTLLLDGERIIKADLLGAHTAVELRQELAKAGLVE